MRRGIWHILAVMALMIPAHAAEVIAPERVQGFVDVIAQNGCRMNIYRADELLPQAGYADAIETKTITEMLIFEGRARILEGELVVFGGTCDAATKYTGRERFFAALADNSCTMTTEQSDVILPRVGVELQEVRLLMDRMILDEEVSLSSDERSVRLSDEICSKYKGMSSIMMASLPPKPKQRAPREIRKDFLAYMASVDCTLTRSEAQNELPRAGFNANEVRPIIQGLIMAGDAEMTGEDDLLTIKSEICQ